MHVEDWIASEQQVGVDEEKREPGLCSPATILIQWLQDTNGFVIGPDGTSISSQLLK